MTKYLLSAWQPHHDIKCGHLENNLHGMIQVHDASLHPDRHSKGCQLSWTSSCYEQRCRMGSMDFPILAGTKTFQGYLVHLNGEFGRRAGMSTSRWRCSAGKKQSVKTTELLKLKRKSASCIQTSTNPANSFVAPLVTTENPVLAWAGVPTTSDRPSTVRVTLTTCNIPPANILWRLTNDHYIQGSGASQNLHP